MSFILGTTKDKVEELMLRHLTFVVMQIEIQLRVGLFRKMLHQRIPLFGSSSKAWPVFWLFSLQNKQSSRRRCCDAQIKEARMLLSARALISGGEKDGS